MKKVILSLVLIMIIISFTSAESISSITTSQNSCINLQQTITNATNCYITIQYPLNNSPIFSNESMIKSGDIYSYNFCVNKTLGDYIVITQCNPNGILDNPIPYVLRVTATGKEFTLVDIFVYLFFLIICGLGTIFSFKLTKKNPIQKDLNNSQLYEMKKTHELKFYIELIKRKMWMVGIFGIYLFTLIFLSFLDQLLFTIGSTDITYLLNPIIQILYWGLVPFVLFWLAYIIIYFWKSSTEIIKYQYGNMR